MNITKMFIRSFIALILCYFAFPPMATAHSSPMYEAIKGIENQFPIPTPTQSITVGTFNAATGKFTGLKTEIIMPEGNGGGFGGTVLGPDGKPINIGGGGGGPRPRPRAWRRCP